MPPSIRQLDPALTKEMLAPLDARCRVVQFNSMLSDDGFARVRELLRARPDVMLRAYGSYDNSIVDVEFLRFFPDLRSFQVDVYGLSSIDGLRHLPDDLEYLGLGQTKRRMDLTQIGRFGALTDLYLEGHTKNFDVVSSFAHLVDLTLRSITLPDLSALVPLRSLRALDIKLGGTTDIQLLPNIGELRYLELWMVRGLAELSPVSAVESLRFLFLQALRRVEALPDFSRMPDLRGVNIETMKGLTDVCGLSDATGLEELFLIDMAHLRPEDVGCLVGHPSLRAATIGLGSLRKNETAVEMLGLPRVSSGKADWRRAATGR